MYLEDLSSPTETRRFRQFWSALQKKAVRAFMDPSGIRDEGEVDIRERLDEKKRKLIPEPSDDLREIRDRALILVGIAGNLRRSELSRLDREDLAFREDRVVLTVRHEESRYPTRRMEILAVEDRMLCPVTALRRWLGEAEITSGPVFRGINRHGQVSDKRLSGRAVTYIVKRAAEAHGDDRSDFSAEDLRQRPVK